MGEIERESAPTRREPLYLPESILEQQLEGLRKAGWKEEEQS